MKKEWLHENVLRVLPTLDVLLFAVDVSVPHDVMDLKCIKRELDVMLGASTKDITLVVLCCFDTTTSNRQNGKRPCFDMSGLATALEMHQLDGRAWSIFEVDIKDMKGFVNALRWTFYRKEKQRSQLKYHNTIAKSSFELQERLRKMW